MPRITTEGWTDFSPLESSVSIHCPRIPLDYRTESLTGFNGEPVPFKARARNGFGLDIYEAPALPFGYVQIGDLVIMDSELKKQIPRDLQTEYDSQTIWLSNGKSVFWTANHLFYAALPIYILQTLDLRGKHVGELGAADGVMGLTAKKLGAKAITCAEISPRYQPFFRQHLIENNMGDDDVHYLTGDFNDDAIKSALMDKPIDIIVSNIGPYYGNAHLEAIEIGTKIPGVRTYIDGAYSLDKRQKSPEHSINLLKDIGFSTNFRDASYERSCYSFAVDKDI